MTNIENNLNADSQQVKKIALMLLAQARKFGTDTAKK